MCYFRCWPKRYLHKCPEKIWKQEPLSQQVHLQKTIILSTFLHHDYSLVLLQQHTKIFYCKWLRKEIVNSVFFLETTVTFQFWVDMKMKTIPCINTLETVIFNESTNFGFFFTCWKFDIWKLKSYQELQALF